jgi:ATP-dependent protease HslVU (ClpYQ) ATPase subunit
MSGQTVNITAKDVQEKVSDLAKNADLSKFIL